MGYALSWLATSAPAQTTRDLLGLRPTGAQATLPTVPFAGAALSNGWYLVVAGTCDASLIAAPTLALLSAQAEVVACAIEEHVMFSRACAWSKGAEVWSVAHDAQRTRFDLETSGALPPFFAELRDQILAPPAAEDHDSDVDYIFDVPLAVAQRLTGFKHDADGEPARFDVFELRDGSILAPAKPWWRFWS
jgi:hypothetical protein